MSVSTTGEIAMGASTPLFKPPILARRRGGEPYDIAPDGRTFILMEDQAAASEPYNPKSAKTPQPSPGRIVFVSGLADCWTPLAWAYAIARRRVLWSAPSTVATPPLREAERRRTLGLRLKNLLHDSVEGTTVVVYGLTVGFKF